MVRVNAKSFQQPLAELAETMVQKMLREGSGRLGSPDYVGGDVAMMLRHALSIYNFLFYLNADERRKKDCYWRVTYGVITMPLVRTLIDCLYNIVAILEDPVNKGEHYRKAGLTKLRNDLSEVEQQYSGQTNWQNYINERRSHVDSVERNCNFNSGASTPPWPTLGQYLRQGGAAGLTDRQKLLMRLSPGLTQTVKSVSTVR